MVGGWRVREEVLVWDEKIANNQAVQSIDVVVLAQLSMSVFSLSYPDPVASFGVPVLNSGETGFARAGEVLRGNSGDKK